MATSASRASPTIGTHLRDWRQRRRLSQLDLAGEANISARHLSFVETGRSMPSREMILHLAEQLQIPMRERNVLLVAAGFAPIFVERSLDDPALAVTRSAIDLVLEGHKPYPAFAIDRHWQIVASNLALPQLYEGVAEHLLTPPINAMRISLHPEGLAPRIHNLPEWRATPARPSAPTDRLDRGPGADRAAPRTRVVPPGGGAKEPTRRAPEPAANVVVPFRISTAYGELAFFSTTMIFGTPVDITLAELAIESFFAADAATVDAVRRLSAQAPSPAEGNPS